MSARVGAAALLLCVALAMARPAHAQLHFAGDAPRVYTIEPREHRYRHELSLGTGVLPLDSFYVGVLADIAYSYRFSQLWSWEVARGFYSFSLDTPLKKQVEDLGAAPSDASRMRMRLMLSSNAMVRPMYGKLALFNRGIAQVETAFTAGLGAAVTNLDTRFAANFGAVMHFWVSRAVAVRFDVRDYLMFAGGAPTNVLMFGLAASFNFSVRLSDPDALPEAPAP